MSEVRDKFSPRNKGYIVPVRVLVAAWKLDLDLPTLTDMLNRSARTTHPKGNRRFHDFVFQVEGSKVTSLSRMSDVEVAKEQHKEVVVPIVKEPMEFYKCDTCQDSGNIKVFNECDACKGVGCKYCDEGLVPAKIRCPACTQKTTIGVWQDRLERDRFRN